MASVNDVLGGFSLPGITFNTAAFSSSTAAVGQLSGNTPIMILNNSGGTPGTLTPRTAAQMIVDSNLNLGQTWWLFLVNGQGTGVLTLGTATGVTVTGTATVAANTARLYVATVTSVTIAAPAINFANVGFSFTATALAFGA